MTDTNWRDDEWRESASCRQVDPELWFPDKGGDPGTDAKRICARCPVRSDCEEYALATAQRYGIWAGMGEHELRRLRAARGLVRPSKRVPVDEVLALAARGWSPLRIASEVGSHVDSVRRILKARREQEPAGRVVAADPVSRVHLGAPVDSAGIHQAGASAGVAW